MGGLGNRLEIAVIRSTWEITLDGNPVIAGEKTRKGALRALFSKLAAENTTL